MHLQIFGTIRGLHAQLCSPNSFRSLTIQQRWKTQSTLRKRGRREQLFLGDIYLRMCHPCARGEWIRRHTTLFKLTPKSSRSKYRAQHVSLVCVQRLLFSMAFVTCGGASGGLRRVLAACNRRITCARKQDQRFLLSYPFHGRITGLVLDANQ